MLSAKGLSTGEKNGPKIGTSSNIAVKDAPTIHGTSEKFPHFELTNLQFVCSLKLIARIYGR